MIMKNPLTAAACLLLCGTLSAFQYGKPADQAASQPAGGDAAVVAEQLPSYPATTCLVSGEPLTSMGEPFDMVHEGRLVRLCCRGCVRAVERDAARYFSRLDALVIAAQKDAYPLTTCPVGGNALEEPVDHVHGTRLVRFCCENCVAGFERDPARYMVKIDAALMEAQKASYPLDTCVVSGEGLHEMGEPVDVLYGTRLVRFCCKMCVKEFRKEPAPFLAKVAAATAPRRAAEKAGEGRAEKDG